MRLFGSTETTRRRRVDLGRSRAPKGLITEARTSLRPLTTALSLLAGLFAIAVVALRPSNDRIWPDATDTLGLAILVLGVATLLVLHVLQNRRDILDRPGAVFLLAGLALLPLVTSKVFDEAGWPVCATPIALTAMVLAIGLDQATARTTTIVACLLVAIGSAATAAGSDASSAGEALFPVVALLVGGLLGTTSVARLRDRDRLIWAGLATGLGTGLAQLALQVPFRGWWHTPPTNVTLLPGLWAWLEAPTWALGSGTIVGFVLYHTLPLVERLFAVTTDVTLLKWADHNHPILKRFAVEAPGTYHHSMMVATLAEAGAEAIGANATLCRVGAYYHDVGKLAKPDYFFENTLGRPSKHESLNPAMSALIILSHPKDGADIAKEVGLPPAVVDFIREHHGTTPVEYFFDKAVKQGGDAGSLQWKFRYPGPRPRSRETAILMLADTVEAVTRSIAEPTSNRIADAILRVFRKKMDDGQFDDAPITVSELARVREAFLRRLTAIYHARIRYPGQTEAERATPQPQPQPQPPSPLPSPPIEPDPKRAAEGAS